MSVVFLPRHFGAPYRRPSRPWEPVPADESWRCASHTRPRTPDGAGPTSLFLRASSPFRLRRALRPGGTFLSGSPNLLKARLIVAVETRTPADSSKSSQCSASVRSGLARTWAGSVASSAAPLRAGGPGTGLGSTSPVCWRRASGRALWSEPTRRRSARPLLLASRDRRRPALSASGLSSRVSCRESRTLINPHASRCR